MDELDIQQIVDLFSTATDKQKEQIAGALSQYIWDASRSRALNDAKQFVNMRILADGVEVTEDANGVVVGLTGGKGQFDILNLIGATANINSASNARQLDVRVGGGGADCMFDYLVSECWADEVAAGRGTEGQVMTSISGCTFKMYSTVTGCLTQAGTDMVAAGSGTNRTVYICPGVYAESPTWTTGTTTVGSFTVVGSGIEQTIINGSLTIDGLNATGEYITLRDLSIVNALVTSSDSNVGDRIVLLNIEAGGLTLGADVDGLWAQQCIITNNITIGANSSAMYFINCDLTGGILNAGNLERFYWLGGEITGPVTLQQWDTAHLETLFNGDGSAGYHFRGTGSGNRGLTLKGYFTELSGASATKNYIEFDQGATVTIDTFIDVMCEKPTSTANEVHLINNRDSAPMRGVQVRLHCGMNSAGTILEDMTGAYASVYGPFTDSTFYLTPNRAKVQITSGVNNKVISGDGTVSSPGSASLGFREEYIDLGQTYGVLI